MATCVSCKAESILISSPLCLCSDCILNRSDEVKSHIEQVHAQSRAKYGLPSGPPRQKEGLRCDICVNRCQVPQGERGYCGVRWNRQGEFEGGAAGEGNLSWYHDGLPTNCVADWVCPAGTECGYPEFSFSEGPEYGYDNLAVFFKACTFNCLFCQNWHYREESTSRARRSPEEMCAAVDSKTACICYFGGDPTAQLPYALRASRLAMEKRNDGILRICWETNGSMNPDLLKEMAEISLKSGGCIKFDLKAWHEQLNLALCGVTNSQTLSNFKLLAKYSAERPEPPFLVASTLLVPGYVDEQEVGKIAEFIASLNPEIPYSLLAFYPHFHMKDLPTTSGKHAERCYKAAVDAGLKRVKIGNLHLLGNAY